VKSWHTSSARKAALLVLLVLLFGLPAQAYRTAGDLPEFDGEVIWQTPTIPLTLSAIPGTNLSVLQTEDALLDAIHAWAEPACSALAFDYLGRANVSAVREDGRNQVEWVLSGWQARGFQSDQLAVTDLVYAERESGAWHIVEADIYLNGALFAETVGAGPGATEFLHSVLLHELGHVAGFLHPCEPGGAGGAPACSEEHTDALMHPLYKEAEAQLSPDELDGVCQLYGAEGCPAVPCEEPLKCVAGECRAECGDSYCPTGQACFGGVCAVSPPNASSCWADCSTEACEPQDCMGGHSLIHDPCLEQKECAEGRCTPAGYCSHPCSDEIGCPGEHDRCVAGACEPAGARVGEACSTARECETKLCVVTDPGGSYCTRACGLGCPTGWHCKAVDSQQVCVQDDSFDVSGCGCRTTGGPTPGFPGVLGWGLGIVAYRLRRSRAGLVRGS
jgi:hypothetical protein